MDNYTRLANQIINEAMTCSRIEDEETTDSEIIKFAHELGIEEELILSPDGDLINRDEMLERISEEEDAEEEPHAKDTDDATHKGGKLYQGGHQFRKRQSSERARLRGKRVYNPETGEYEMPEDELDNYRIKSEDGEGLSEKDLKTIMTVKKLAGGDAKGGIFSNPEKDIQKAYGAMLTKISKQVQNIAKNI